MPEPVPFVAVPPGVRVNVQVPVEGNPFSTTLPVSVVQVRLVIAPITGGEGLAFTVNVYVAVAGVQGRPDGLSVVTVMTIVLPASSGAGVYENVKGDVPEEDGLSDPAPFSLKVTLVALPPKVLPATVTIVVPHTLPLMELRDRVGELMHGHATVKRPPAVVQP